MNTMSKIFLEKTKERLEEERKQLEQQLKGFAKKDEVLQHDWDTKFPKFDSASGGQQLEDEAGEVEEYVSKLPVEYSLEERLKNINLALDKIKTGKYGYCEKCKQKISKERLEIMPEAKTCTACK